MSVQFDDEWSKQFAWPEQSSPTGQQPEPDIFRLHFVFYGFSLEIVMMIFHVTASDRGTYRGTAEVTAAGFPSHAKCVCTAGRTVWHTKRGEFGVSGHTAFV